MEIKFPVLVTEAEHEVLKALIDAGAAGLADLEAGKGLKQAFSDAEVAALKDLAAIVPQIIALVNPPAPPAP